MAAKTAVRINARLVDEAVKALDAKSGTDAVHTALKEIVELHRCKEADEEELRKAEICQISGSLRDEQLFDRFFLTQHLSEISPLRPLRPLR